MSEPHCLALRLVGPLQSWGSSSQFNRRDTDNAPTKSGVIGLLAAADGRRRGDPIEDLVDLRFGVRVDCAGTILRDYHTVSDLRGRPLLAAKVDSKGRQKATQPAKHTGVTQRFYLQDSAFVAIVEGDRSLLDGLAAAVREPTFPLALGRRSCVPSAPLLVESSSGVLWPGSVADVLEAVPWQAPESYRTRLSRQKRLGATVRLAASMDSICSPGSTDDDIDDVRADVPHSFDHLSRGFSIRSVRHTWVTVPTDVPESTLAHDPFELLGW